MGKVSKIIFVVDLLSPAQFFLGWFFFFFIYPFSLWLLAGGKFYIFSRLFFPLSYLVWNFPAWFLNKKRSAFLLWRYLLCFYSDICLGIDLFLRSMDTDFKTLLNVQGDLLCFWLQLCTIKKLKVQSLSFKCWRID